MKGSTESMKPRKGIPCCREEHAAKSVKPRKGIPCCREEHAAKSVKPHKGIPDAVKNTAKSRKGVAGRVCMCIVFREALTLVIAR